MAAPDPTNADGERESRGRRLGGLSDPRTLRDLGGLFVVNLFIVFHVAAFLAWCLPIQSLIVTNFKERIKSYMLASSLFQSWDMFAPDPLRLNLRVDAEITFRDGETRTWYFPRMDELGFVDRYFKERYRKYATEYLRADGYEALRPDAARYVARLHNQPENPPVTVTLYRSWSQMQRPAPDGSYRADPWTRVSFFTYTVTPGDLQ
jgi:hypothetical protein